MNKGQGNRIGMVFMLLANIMVTILLNATPRSEQAGTVYMGVAIVLFLGGAWLYTTEDQS